MVGIDIYTKTFCPYCEWAKRLLARKGVQWREIMVTGDRERFAEMMERSGGRRTAPQVFIQGVHVGGYDELKALDERGDLDPLLDGARNDAEADPATASEEPADSGRDDAQDDEEDAVVEAADEHRPVIILGSGCAGMTAAIYAARANLEPLVVEGLEFGGQLYTTTDVENYPGFPEGIQGPELMERMKAQAERFGARFVAGEATELQLAERPFGVVLSDGTRYLSDALIVATGASPRELGLPKERELRGHGVSTCATCDAPFFRDDVVAVVGGGDTAMEDALFISKFASRVLVIHRRDELRASEIMQQRAFDNDTIEFLWNTEVVAFHGDAEGGGLTGIRVVDNVTREERDLDVGGCFLAIGHVPNTEILARSGIRLDEHGYVDPDGRHIPFTEVEGIFVAGDVHDHRYRQAVTAAGYGCRAAMDAERWLEERPSEQPASGTTRDRAAPAPKAEATP